MHFITPGVPCDWWHTSEEILHSFLLAKHVVTLFKCGKGWLAAHLNKQSLLLWPVGFGKQAEHARNVSQV
jgi:hypothetical protein